MPEKNPEVLLEDPGPRQPVLQLCVHCVLVIKDKLKLLQMQTRYGGWQADGTEQWAGLRPFVFLLQVVTSKLPSAFNRYFSQK